MKHLSTAMAILIAVSIVLAASFSFAADTVLDVQIESAVSKLDKNGNEYVRFIVPIQATLNGIKYTKTVPVMAFSNMAEDAKKLKAGDQLRAICSVREYQGRESYTILAFINQ
jgi:hypothetical protein